MRSRGGRGQRSLPATDNLTIRLPGAGERRSDHIARIRSVPHPRHEAAPGRRVDARHAVAAELARSACASSVDAAPRVLENRGRRPRTDDLVAGGRKGALRQSIQRGASARCGNRKPRTQGQLQRARSIDFRAARHRPDGAPRPALSPEAPNQARSVAPCALNLRRFVTYAGFRCRSSHASSVSCRSHCSLTSGRSLRSEITRRDVPGGNVAIAARMSGCSRRSRSK